MAFNLSALTAQQQAAAIYIGYYDRAPDPVGSDFWESVVAAGNLALAEIATDFSTQTETRAEHPFFVNPTAAAANAFITEVYMNLFNRAPDADGLEFWSGVLQASIDGTGALSVGQIILEIIQGAQDSDEGNDLTTIQNKIAVGTAWTDAAKVAGLTEPQSYANDADAQASAKSILEGVTDSAATVTAAEATTVAFFAAGETFTLTAGTDLAGKSSASTSGLASDFRFTDGRNEVVNADVSTLQAADVLLDGSSTDNDVLNITSIGNSGAFTANRIETINLEGVAGVPVLNMTNVSFTNAINVSGTVATKIDVLDAQIKTPMITSESFTRDLNIDLVTAAGTTAAGNAETVNLTVSGASYGTTAATRSQVTIEAAANGTLETLNVTSAGDTANDFSLVGGTNVAFGTVNLLGDQDVTVRATHADVTGVKIDATGAAGTVDLTVDRNGATTTATNILQFTGIDNITLVDSTVGTDTANLTGISSGATVTIADDFVASTFGFAGVAGSSDSATIVLDNETADTDLDIAGLTILDVETLTITSNGFASSTSTSAQNSITDLVADATTITVNGDTSLDLNLDINAPTTGNRVVKVDASGNTAFVDIAAGTDAKVSYELTGTAGADTLTLNASGGKITAGDGKDTVTGGDGVDTIDLGAGDDTYNVSFGKDSVTLGAGKDTVDIDSTGAAAVAKVVTTGDVDGGLTTVAAQDDFIVTLDGATYKLDVATDGDDSDDISEDFVAEFGAAILAAHGVTVTITGGAGAKSLVFTGKADGTDFTVDATLSDNGVIVPVVETITTAGSAAKDVATTITDFLVGDVLNTEGLTGLGTGGYYEGAAAGMTAGTAYGVVVITDKSYASVTAASTDINVTSTSGTEALVVFLNSTTGKAEAYYDNNLNADAVAGGDDANLFTFDNITTLQGIADTFSSDSFVI